MATIKKASKKKKTAKALAQEGRQEVGQARPRRRAPPRASAKSLPFNSDEKGRSADVAGRPIFLHTA